MEETFAYIQIRLPKTDKKKIKHVCVEKNCTYYEIFRKLLVGAGILDKLKEEDEIITDQDEVDRIMEYPPLNNNFGDVT